MTSQAPCQDNEFLAEHVMLLQSSYQRLTGRLLFPHAAGVLETAKVAFSAPFVLVSHNTLEDPVFNYANRAALKLFEMPWSEFTQLRSRESAEPANQQERARLLADVTNKGFCEGYSGIRISKTGKRFWIRDVTVWNLTDDSGCYQGQAAVYANWEYL
ncbi:hypothetical protein MNBD_GAMMA26-1162 [hydrothermal vent metagenome]|uniref:MEKHLA domain-containing protein n=1 Tax=hydrothermal vent metagenome TaxID=652676 RepID=A0A3B1BE74_9ZZZZ